MVAPATVPKATSNADFGRRVGIHYTFASRIRNGHRLPSLETLSNIVEAFELSDADTIAMLAAAKAGPEAFGAWVNDHLFEESTSVDR